MTRGVFLCPITGSFPARLNSIRNIIPSLSPGRFIERELRSEKPRVFRSTNRGERTIMQSDACFDANLFARSRAALARADETRDKNKSHGSDSRRREFQLPSFSRRSSTLRSRADVRHRAAPPRKGRRLLWPVCALNVPMNDLPGADRGRDWLPSRREFCRHTETTAALTVSLFALSSLRTLASAHVGFSPGGALPPETLNHRPRVYVYMYRECVARARVHQPVAHVRHSP